MSQVSGRVLLTASHRANNRKVKQGEIFTVFVNRWKNLEVDFKISKFGAVEDLSIEVIRPGARGGGGLPLSCLQGKVADCRHKIAMSHKKYNKYGGGEAGI